MASYELFSDTEILGRMALERMLAGLSTLAGVHELGQGVVWRRVGRQTGEHRSGCGVGRIDAAAQGR